MINSAEMVLRYRQMANLTRARGDVFLIYRLNQDETQVGGIFAAPYKADRDQLIQGIRPVSVLKLQTQSDRSSRNRESRSPAGFVLRSGVVGPGRADNQGGGHAEELFLLWFLARVKLAPVTHVEIMLSRLPCHATSPAWRLAVAEGEYLPPGCGPKLVSVMRRFNTVQWTLAYDELADMNLADMGEINALPNATSGSVMNLVAGM